MLHTGVPRRLISKLPQSQRRDRFACQDFRGKKHVSLAFHPLAFTPVCAAADADA